MIRSAASLHQSRLVASALLAGALSACGGGGSATPRALPPVPVMVARAEQRTMPLTVRAVGHVESIATVAVRPRVGGELQKVHFEEGQAVAKDQVLFTIDPRPYQAALREAEARLVRDQALLRKSEADLVRYADLVKRDFVTREQFDLITATVESMRATVAADQAAVDSARLQLDYCTVAAPVGGRTGSLLFKAGNLVKANDDKALVTINQTRPIYVSFAVPAENLPSVRGKAGDGLRVNAFLPAENGTPETGTLAVIDNQVDTATGTVALKAVFPNGEERLWPGQFVDVELLLEQQQGRVVVPAAAVQTSQQGSFVYVVGDGGAAELRPVQVARQDEHDAVIDTGVQAGETVVTDGQLRLVPGARVEVKERIGSATGARP